VDVVRQLASTYSASFSFVRTFPRNCQLAFSARKICVSFFFHYCSVVVIRCEVEVKNQTVQTGSGAHPAANSVETEDSFPE
jgi:hypothetical protein